MNFVSKSRVPFAFSAVALCAFAGVSLHAQTTYTWTPTTAGAAYNWNNSGSQNNWGTGVGGPFPSMAGDVANVNNDILGAQTVRLRQAITIGTLNLGDADAVATPFGFTIGNNTGETFALTFDSGTAAAAQLNLTASGAAGNTIGVPVVLGSNLNVNLGAAQTLTVSSTGSIATGSGAAARNLTLTGGTAATNQVTITGDLSGSGVVTNNSNAALIMGGTAAKTFTGTFVLNKGTGGSNTGSLTVTNSSIANAAEVVINGYLSGAGITQNGGSLYSGNGSSQTTNPGQRLTQNRITLNGGSLQPNGQALSGAAAGTAVTDNVSVLDFNSGYSLVTLSASNTSGGTFLNVTTIERSPGATAFLRGSSLAGVSASPLTPSELLAGNAASFLKGAGGPEGSTTMSIVPWLVGNNTNASASSSTVFTTYVAGGFRALTAAEQAGSLSAGATANVSTGGFGVLGADTTVNSLNYTTASASNIGTGRTLIIASGALGISLTNGGIGAAGAATAGTLQFGTNAAPAEGVVWVPGANSSGIGASISGSLGLTKAGTGTLTLTGSNTFTGDVYVSGGTLQIGNGTNPSNLTLDGDVGVANGALLSLFNGSAIPDDATLRLENFGLFNGKLNLNAGVNETIGTLFFGDLPQLAGTWGSTGSGAQFTNDTFFSGQGVLTVVIPEPASAALLLCGAGALLGLRRRRA